MKAKLTNVISICIVGIGLLMVSSCKDKSLENQDGVSKKLVVLKVDYSTYDFEGGQLIELPAYTNLTDTLPIIINYIEPSDFGSLSVYYSSTNSSSLVFDGSVIWAGLGSRSYPSTLAAAPDFPLLSAPLANIDSTEFQLVHYELGNQKIYYDSIWGGINNLDVVNYCRSQNSTKMALFLYQPSLGPGDPADWDWYIVMEK